MAAGATYEPIATTTLGSAASTVTFSSIPGTYTDLIVVANVGCSSASQRAGWQANSNTGSNYSRTILVGTGSSTASDRESNATAAYGIFDALSGVPTTLVGNFITQFQNYSNTTTNKTAITRYNDAGGGTGVSVQLFRSTSAITSITFLLSGGNWIANSTFTLYGIAAA
jgi:hypothetical protein